MVIRRGEIWWADLGEIRGSAPGEVHPVVVVQCDELNASRLRTAVVVVMTSNLARAEAPGNVYCPARDTKLPRDIVINVTQLATLDRASLLDHVGSLPARLLARVDDGLRLALGL
jgi:mRNA interferase MazF